MGQMPKGVIPGDIKTASNKKVYGTSHKQYGVSDADLNDGITDDVDAAGPGKFNEPKPAPHESE